MAVKSTPNPKPATAKKMLVPVKSLIRIYGSVSALRSHSPRISSHSSLTVRQFSSSHLVSKEVVHDVSGRTNCDWSYREENDSNLENPNNNAAQAYRNVSESIQPKKEVLVEHIRSIKQLFDGYGCWLTTSKDGDILRCKNAPTVSQMNLIIEFLNENSDIKTCEIIGLSSMDNTEQPTEIKALVVKAMHLSRIKWTLSNGNEHKIEKIPNATILDYYNNGMCAEPFYNVDWPLDDKDLTDEEFTKLCRLFGIIEKDFEPYKTNNRPSAS